MIIYLKLILLNFIIEDSHVVITLNCISYASHLTKTYIDILQIFNFIKYLWE